MARNDFEDGGCMQTSISIYCNQQGSRFPHFFSQPGHDGYVQRYLDYVHLNRLAISLRNIFLLFIVHIALDRCRRRSEHRRADGRGQRTSRVQHLHDD